MLKVGSVTLLLFVGALVSLVSNAGAAVRARQETVIISDEVMCPECEIRITRVATLGAKAEEPLICGFNTKVAADSRGRFYVAPTCVDGQINVYSIDGDFIRTIGQRGQGPAEFGIISWIYVGPDDYLYVVERSHSTKILAPNHEEYSRFARPVPYPYALALGNVGDDMVLASRIRGGRSNAGYTLHVHAFGGEFRRSFSRERHLPNESGDRWQNSFRMLARADDGKVWSSRSQPDEYVLELWNIASTASPIRTIRRDVAWYEQPETAGAQVQGLHLDQDGLLWSLLALSPYDWEWGDQTRTPEEINRDRFSVLEVLDPDNGALVTRSRTNAVFERFTGHQMMYSFRGVPDGNNVIDIFRFELVTPTSSSNRQQEE